MTLYNSSRWYKYDETPTPLKYDNSIIYDRNDVVFNKQFILQIKDLPTISGSPTTICRIFIKPKEFYK